MRGTTLVPPVVHQKWSTRVVPRWYHKGKMTTFQFIPRSTLILTPYFWVKIRGQIRGQYGVNARAWYHPGTTGGTKSGPRGVPRVVPYGKMTTFQFFLRSTLIFDPLFLGQNKGSNKGSIRGQNTCVVPPWYHPGTTFGTTGGTRVVPHGKMTTFRLFLGATSLRPQDQHDPPTWGE